MSNLLGIHSALSGQSLESLEVHFEGKGYGTLKSELADMIIETLNPVRKKYNELVKNKDYLDEILAKGAEAAQKRAYKMLAKVYRKAGFPDKARC